MALDKIDEIFISNFPALEISFVPKAFHVC